MDFNWCKVSPIISIFVLLLCFKFFICSIQPVNCSNTTHNFRVENESRKSNYIEALLEKINKPSVKTIQIDGDVIDCVSSHLQPSFDHPLLKGQKPLTDPLEIPEGHNMTNTTMFEDSFQGWSISGESCPENTIPIKRTTEQDVLRTKSFRKLGHKIVRRESNGFTQDHAIGYATGKFFGAKATISIWHPRVEHKDIEFSLSQMWVMASTQGGVTLDSIEVGWQVYPWLYGDSNPRLFIFWTNDSYSTGCYNVAHCPGFVQKSNKILFGGQIKSVSSYNGAQYDLPIFVWKDPKTKNWWLQINNEIVGYWPSFLFTLLKDRASVVEFGGEIVNSGETRAYTKTEMGSGHFPSEGYKKAAFIRNIELVDSKNNLYSAPKLLTVIQKPNWYSVETVKKGPVWGSYLFYGGPGGANPGCE